LILSLATLAGSMIGVALVVNADLSQIEAATAADHEVHEELRHADGVVEAIRDMETGLRRFAVARDPDTLPDYEAARLKLDRELIQLTKYASDDPVEERREVAEFGRLSDNWIETVADPVIAAAPTGRPIPDLDIKRKALLADVRADNEDLKLAENDLLRRRERAMSVSVATGRFALLFGLVVAIAVSSLIAGRAMLRLDKARRHERIAAVALGEALNRAQRAEDARSRLLSNVSHEMRTPLNGVVGMAQVLGRTPLNEDQRTALGTILSSSSALDRLLGDLLAVAAGEDADPIVGSPEAFTLTRLLVVAAAPFQAAAAAKGVAFHLDLPEDADRPFSGQPERLKQLLEALLSNAVKFTAAGEIRLGVERISAGRHRFEVSDTGIGMPASQLDSLFTPFAVGDDSDTRAYSGAGLGLAHAQMIAKRLETEIICCSAAGRGTTFSVEMNLAPAKPGAEFGEIVTPSAAEIASEIGAGPSLRLLVVDDNATNREILQTILRQLGVEAECACDGAEAVEAVRNGRYDLIFMDVQMPVMDGITATRAIRTLEREEGRPTTPVIVVSTADPTASPPPTPPARRPICRSPSMCSRWSTPSRSR
jgi:signal transduction histidine kinase